MKVLERNDVNFRISVIGVFFAILLTVVTGKAVQIQVYQGVWLANRAASEYEQSFKLPGKRGTIWDTTGREMAISTEVVSVAAYPKKIRDAKLTAASLARVMGTDFENLYAALSSKRSFAWVRRQIGHRQAEAIKALDLEGIDFIPEYSRFYPNRWLAAQVLGFMGIDEKGLGGVEFHYDDDLKGEKQEFKRVKDALGRGFESESQNFSGVSGHNVVLTLDKNIQYITEKALEEAATDSLARSGMAIVMSPKTGEILAMANYPFFNPNRYKDFTREIWKNRCITDAFEPGSTMKVFSAAAAIESGLCTPNTIFYCENGQYSIGGHIVHDTKSHGWLPLHKIIKYSSNIGAIKISMAIGPEILYKTLSGFGFGEKTGIEFPGEASGRLSPYRKWSKIEAGTIAFGHGISVTALQMITAVSAIANDGILMKPYLVKEIRDEQGNTVSRFGPQIARRAISADTARTVTRMMMSVVEEGGTGTAAKLSGYSSCGKTGTAQKPDTRGEYSNHNYVASYIGFAPVESPRLAILVVLDEPRKNYYGGLVAAPVFKKIAEATLAYLNVQPADTADGLTADRKDAANG